MDIKIFEDQTGLMMFPDKGLDKMSPRNMDIVRLFDNKIDLRISNIENFLEIACYLLVRRGQERAIGCYIVGRDNYTDRTFGNFKKDANSALKNIGFEHHYDNTENVVFDHMEKFDMDGRSHTDIGLIVGAKNSGERVNYKGGDIGEIAVFCRQILKRVSNIDIVISTVESNLGDVNITRSKTHGELLSPTVQGKQALDRQIIKAEQMRAEEQRKLEERKKEKESRVEENRRIEEDKGKQKEREIVDGKIEKGTSLIKEGLEIKRRAGYSDLEIDSYLIIVNNVINGKLEYFPYGEIGESENEPLEEEGIRKKEEKIRKGEIGNDKIKEGTFILKDAIVSKRKDGYSDIEINSDFRIKNSGIIVKNYVGPDENKKYYKYDDSVKADDVKSSTYDRLFPIIVIATILIIIWLLASLIFYKYECVPNYYSGNVCDYANIAVNILKRK